ncbi:cytidylate kinase [Fontibacillus solani]|uniref:(d)CMP kinase n=1 Tax=Fontibacillus solani TaxID=1572857 RepID=A0A7W3XSR5_9BACL|nr:(d)CMP kinase [Fontibacillus solani]MBA9086868.1 cytidylate kinase [Fontibacillus solani]
MIPIITIDGSTASGKTTIGKLLSKKYGFLYFDAGIVFRCLAWLCKNEAITINEEFLIKSSSNMVIDISREGSVFCNNKDVSNIIWDEEYALISAEIGQYNNVRKILKGIKREMVKKVIINDKHVGIVVVGRDVGLNIFPETNFKFFLYCEKDVRINRRRLQLEHDQEIDKRLLSEIIKKRDYSMKARDAITIDNSTLDPDETVLLIEKNLAAKSEIFNINS